jgi:hypothetical protein
MAFIREGKVMDASGSSSRQISATAYPRRFSLVQPADSADPYLNHPPIRKLVQFFEAKTLAVIKHEDQREQWYDDWLAYQAEHRLYASVLSPGQYSTLGFHFDLLRYSRFLEVFAYFSPAHGYSAQVTFLGLFAILMGSNGALKQEAVAALERVRPARQRIQDHGGWRRTIRGQRNQVLHRQLECRLDHLDSGEASRSAAGRWHEASPVRAARLAS